jgi:hypothetical protein
MTYLVTVSEGEVLDTDVLVRVLGALLKRGHVGPVLPVLSPEVVSVEATANQAGNNGAVNQLVSLGELQSKFVPTGNILDGQLAPQV